VRPRVLFPARADTSPIQGLSHILPIVTDPYKYLDCDWKSITHWNEGRDTGTSEQSVSFCVSAHGVSREIVGCEKKRSNTTRCRRRDIISYNIIYHYTVSAHSVYEWGMVFLPCTVCRRTALLPVTIIYYAYKVRVNFSDDVIGR